MKGAALEAYLKRGRDTIAAGLVAWGQRSRFGAVALGCTVALSSLSEAVIPPPNIDLPEWAETYRFVSPDSGSPFPGKWSNERVPYAIEPMRALSPSDPCEGVVLKWCAQSSKTEIGINWTGYIAHIERMPMLITLPGLEELNKFNSKKLQPSIDATPIMRQIIVDEVSAKKSTERYKDWPGGGAILASANSSSALQMISVARYWGDECGEYPAEAGKRGDPVKQAKTRMEAWRSMSKFLMTSTCQEKGSCRISNEYDKSDQRKYYVPCPESACGSYQQLEIARLGWSENAGGAKVPVYSCSGCGVDIPEREKEGMMAKGVWIPTFESKSEDNPPPPIVIDAADLEHWRNRDCEGRRIKGYHLWKAYSNLADWASILRDQEEAENDPLSVKAFWQQTLAEPYDAGSDAPDHEELAKVVEGYPDARVPIGAYFTTGAVDVQGDRLEWAVYAWGPNLQGWLIEKGIIEGRTDQITVWETLREFLVSKSYRYPNGETRPVDRWGVDSGYRSTYVYATTKGLPNVYNLDGRGNDKPFAPPLGTPKTIEAKHKGKIISKVRKYDVGGYQLKTQLYGFLRQWKDGPSDDGVWPKGIIHFNEQADTEFFEQVTSEQLLPQYLRGGRVKWYWSKIKNRANEHHDIAIYNLALAYSLGWDAKTPDEWGEIHAVRYAPPAGAQGSLSDLWGASSADGTAGAVDWAGAGLSITGNGSDTGEDDLLARLAAMNADE